VANQKFYPGRKVLIRVGMNNTGGPTENWQLLPAQLDGDVDRKGKNVSTNNKQDDGWESAISVGRSWSISCSGFIDPADPVYQLLLTDWRQSRTRMIQIYRALIGAASEEGFVNVEWKESFGNEDVVKFDATFTGNGSLLPTSAV